MANLTQKKIIAFRGLIYGYFREHGRELPWRATQDPYHILVSEIMLQQTQAERVLHKYEPFITQFPDVAALAGADLGAVLAAWQGLGYNRRCIALHRIARFVVEDLGGRIPDSVETLQTLPGIGKATAGRWSRLLSTNRLFSWRRISGACSFTASFPASRL